MTETLDFRAFGKNDIRGIYGEDVTEELFYLQAEGTSNLYSKTSTKMQTKEPTQKTCGSALQEMQELTPSH